MITLEFQNRKKNLLKNKLKIGQKKFLLLVKIKNIVPWTYVISDLNGKRILEVFMKKTSK